MQLNSFNLSCRLQTSREFIFSIAYFILCNFASLVYRFNIYSSGNIKLALLELFKDSLYILIFLYLFFSALNINRIFYIISSFLIFISGAVASYYLYLFKVQPSSRVLKAVLHAEAQDAIELINIKLLIWVGFVIFVWYWLLRRFPYKAKGIIRYFFSLICLIFVVYNIFNPQFRLLKHYFPSQYLISLADYFSERFKIKPTFDISSLPFQDKSDSDLLVVLVVGESARFDRFEINGYEKSNNPYLSQIKNLHSFKSTACDSITYTSVPCMLKRSISQDIDETTFLSVFAKLGFKTSWLGSQSMLKYLYAINARIFYDEVDFALLPGGSLLYEMNTKDGDLLPYFDNVLSDTGRRHLIVLHTSGSHWDYAARYPTSFERYTPVCKGESQKRDYSSCRQEEISNMYDNSILYTDYILHEIIERLKDKNAILFYTSDHGESLGENGVYGHGGDDIPEQLTVPFFIWTSDIFNARHHELYKNIVKNNKKDINYRYLFHSVLDCANIDSDILDSNLSLCR